MRRFIYFLVMVIMMQTAGSAGELGDKPVRVRLPEKKSTGEFSRDEITRAINDAREKFLMQLDFQRRQWAKKEKEKIQKLKNQHQEELKKITEEYRGNMDILKKQLKKYATAKPANRVNSDKKVVKEILGRLENAQKLSKKEEMKMFASLLSKHNKEFEAALDDFALSQEALLEKKIVPLKQKIERITLEEARLEKVSKNKEPAVVTVFDPKAKKMIYFVLVMQIFLFVVVLWQKKKL